MPIASLSISLYLIFPPGSSSTSLSRSSRTRSPRRKTRSRRRRAMLKRSYVTKRDRAGTWEGNTARKTKSTSMRDGRTNDHVRRCGFSGEAQHSCRSHGRFPASVGTTASALVRSLQKVYVLPPHPLNDISFLKQFLTRTSVGYHRPVRIPQSLRYERVGFPNSHSQRCHQIETLIRLSHEVFFSYGHVKKNILVCTAFSRRKHRWELDMNTGLCSNMRVSVRHILLL